MAAESTAVETSARGPACPLARIEARIALERLLDRARDGRISEDHHGPAHDRRYEQDPTYVLRGLRSLRIDITPDAPEDRPLTS